MPSDLARARVTQIETGLGLVEVLSRLSGLSRAVLVGDWAGGGALVALGPGTPPRYEDPFEALNSEPAGSGWFGVLGYPAGQRIAGVSAPTHRAVRMPETMLAFHDAVLRFEAATQTWWLESTAGADETWESFETEIRERIAGPAPEREFVCGTFATTPSREDHMAGVATVLERIGEGEIFQANLTMRAEATFDGDPFALFLRGIERYAPARAAFVTDGSRAVVSFSPELFLAREGRTIRTEPIKGTRPRTADNADEMLAELLGSQKDRAENVMIVDLMRNDLGRICDTGSVRVPVLCEPQAHPGVWHLVSRIEGRLRRGIGDGDVLRASFPPGSVTGTPKLRAMEVIDELEPAAREVYTGVIGFSTNERAEWNVAIRTFEIADGRIWFGVGGGIVADSDPSAEFEECLVKASPMLEVAGAEIIHG